MFVRKVKRGTERPAVRRLRLALVAQLRQTTGLTADEALTFVRLSKRLASGPATAQTLAEIKGACDRVLLEENMT